MVWTDDDGDDVSEAIARLQSAAASLEGDLARRRARPGTRAALDSAMAALLALDDVYFEDESNATDRALRGLSIEPALLRTPAPKIAPTWFTRHFPQHAGYEPAAGARELTGSEALREAMASPETVVVDVVTDIEARAPAPWAPEGA
jgi:hypothetical protein